MAAEENPRARIITAAGEQLNRFGLARFRVVDVADSAGMTHPNVYRYFTSRTALVDALITNWLKPLEEMIEMVVGAPDPVPDKLERMISAISRAYREAKHSEPALFMAFVEATTAGRAVSRKHRARLRKAFDRVLDEGILSGVISMADRGRAQALLLDACWRFTDPVSILGDQDGDAALASRLERVIEAAIGSLTKRR